MADAREFTHLLCGQAHVRAQGADDAAIAGLASRQHGLVARRQLLDLGISERAVDHRLARGRLRFRHPGVYAVGHEALTFPGLVMAVTMSVAPPPGGHASGDKPLDGGGAVGALGPWGRPDPRNGDAEPHRSPGHRDPSCGRHPRRRGRAALERIVRAYVIGSGRTRSELEDRFLGFCAARGLRLPETNATLEVRGRRLEVDCLWRRERLIVELDGYRAHRTEEAFQDDRARDRALNAAGWSPMRVTWAQLRDHPDTLESEIPDALVTRRDHIRGSAHTGGE